ncbi:hypothetical protein [Amycolatopsis sp. MtRt-6]|uniref:hypothetical protein n=1 Tax=Amycolatopsis sp. MtRt-6 TaxID=2792782 RepID=UPI001A8EE93B|nr:hypothetical protein [Amycolatopsis sp. MtRt-6]
MRGGPFGSALAVLLGVIAPWLIRLGLRPSTRIEHTPEVIAGGDFDCRRRLERDGIDGSGVATLPHARAVPDSVPDR